MKQAIAITIIVLALTSAAASAQDALTIAPDGNVGINNAAPQEQLDVTGNAIVDGELTVTGGLTAPGIPIGVYTFTSTIGDVEVQPGQWVSLITHVVTVREGSRLIAWMDSGQIRQRSALSNPRMRLRVDGTDYGAQLSHRWYDDDRVRRVWLYSHAWTPPLAAGPHTVELVVGAYGGAHTFNFQSDFNRFASMMLMEIAAEAP